MAGGGKGEGRVTVNLPCAAKNRRVSNVLGTKQKGLLSRSLTPEDMSATAAVDRSKRTQLADNRYYDDNPAASS